jgi:tetratricopeptide (TPR) repeat protein
MHGNNSWLARFRSAADALAPVLQLRRLAPLALLAVALGTGAASAQVWDRLNNPKVRVTLTHPPGLGLKVSRIAFGPARGPQVDQFVDALVQGFVTGGIEVLDRAHLDVVLREHDFNLSGFVDQATAAQLGKILGSTALVFVNVQRAATDQQRLYEDLRDTRGYLHRRHIARTRAFFKASVQTVDLTTGRIFQAATVEATPEQAHETVDQCCPEFPSEFTVMDEGLQQAVTQVQRLFLPWNEVRQLHFFDDKDCDLKLAYALLKGGDLDGAARQSEQNAETCRALGPKKDKANAHAHYNLGMMHFLRGDYDKATELFGQAQRIKTMGIITEAMGDASRAKGLAEAMRRVEERVLVDQAPAAATPSRPPGQKLAKADSTQARPAEPAKLSAEERLKKAEELYRKKLITKAEYDRKRAEILSEM